MCPLRTRFVSPLPIKQILIISCLMYCNRAFRFQFQHLKDDKRTLSVWNGFSRSLQGLVSTVCSALTVQHIQPLFHRCSPMTAQITSSFPTVPGVGREGERRPEKPHGGEDRRGGNPSVFDILYWVVF